MKRVRHRLCSCTLVLMLMITLCPVSAKAETEYTYCEAEDGTILITGYTGEASKLEIPETMDGKKVTGIAEGAFAYDLSIREVELPDTITEIGEGAFNDCSQLQTINFPDTLTAIEKDAFFSCTRLEEANLPDGLEVLGDGAFYRCSALEEITVPGEVDEIGDYVFGACENLQSAVLEEGVEEIPQQTFYADSKLSSIELPSTVKEIGMRAFDQCTALTTIDLPEGLQSIGYRAFYSTSIENFTVNAVQIGKEAFYGSAATEINLGADVAEIEEGALDNLKVQIDPENENFMVTEDGVLYTKDQRELVSVPKQFDNGGQPYQVPDGVEIIRNRAFQYCYGVTEVILPDSVTTIGDEAFENSSLTKINLPDSVTEIGEKAFSCIESLGEIDIPSSVKELKEASFSRDDGLSKVTLHEGLEKIDDTVFAYCKNLEELQIPASVTELNGSSFYQYYPVEDESYETLLPTEDGEMEDRYRTKESEDDKEKLPEIKAKQSELHVQVNEENAQFKTGDDGNIYSLDGSVLVAYINHPGETAIEIPDTVSTLRSKAVLSMFATEVKVPTSVTTIKENALGYFIDYYCKIVNMSEIRIYSQEDTAAEEYAKENGIAFYTGTPSPNATEITLQSGETFQYQIENAPVDVLTYASSNNLIASVDQSGCITAKANGTVEIFVLNGNTETQSVRVTVQGGEDPADPYADYQEFTSTETYDNWESDYYDYNKEILALENQGSEEGNELTKEDNSNIVDYSSNNYPAIKAQLIGGKYIKDAEEQFGKGGFEQFKTVAKNLHEEASRYALNQNLKAYSGTSDISFITGGGSTLQELLDSVGKTVTDPCVISTSLAHNIAAAHGKYVMEIYLPKDQTNGAYIKSISAYPSEYEFLLNYGLNFKVVDAGIRTVKVSSYPEPSEEFSYDVTERYVKLVVTSEPDDPDDPDDPVDPDPDDPVKPDPENPDKPDPSNNKKTDPADKKNTADTSKTRKKALKTGDTADVQRGVVLIFIAGVAIVLVCVAKSTNRRRKNK